MLKLKPPILLSAAALALAVSAAPAGASVDSVVAAGPNGSAHFAWTEPATPSVFERTLGGDGALGEAQSVGYAFRTVLSHAIGVDAGGNAIIAWTAVRGDERLVFIRRRAADGTLGRIRQLSPDGVAATDLKLAVGPAGGAVAIWRRELAGKQVVQARRRAPDGTLGPVRTVSDAGADAGASDVATGPDGVATVAWLRPSPGGQHSVEARRLSPDGTLSEITAISAPKPDNRDLHVTVSDAGTAVIAWTRVEDGERVVRSRAMRASGLLVNSQLISSATAGVSDYAFATAGDGTGRTAYVWTDAGGGLPTLRGRIRQPNGALGPIFDMFPGPAMLPDAAFDLNGNVTFAWQIFDGQRVKVYALRRTAGGQTGPQHTLSDPTTSAISPDVAVDAAGKATVAWQVNTTGAYFARTITAGGTASPIKRVSSD